MMSGQKTSYLNVSCVKTEKVSSDQLTGLNFPSMESSPTSLSTCAASCARKLLLPQPPLKLKGDKGKLSQPLEIGNFSETKSRFKTKTAKVARFLAISKSNISKQVLVLVREKEIVRHSSIQRMFGSY